MARSERKPTYQGVIPIQEVTPVVVPPKQRNVKPVDLKPYMTLLRKSEKVRKDRTEADGLEFIVPVEAQHTLRTRLNQAGATLDLGVGLLVDDDQNDVAEGMVRMTLTTGPRRHRNGGSKQPSE